MSAARLLVLAAALAIGLASGATPLNGCTAATDSRALYANTTVSCEQISSCTTTFGTCLGSTLNCTKASSCIAARFACLNKASDNSSCTSLNTLKLSLLKVANGDAFNISDAYKSCVATSCAWLNTTYSGSGGNCTLAYATLCASPINVVVSLLLKGQFSAILNDATKRAKLVAALIADLSKAFGIDDVTILRMFIAGSKRQAVQTLVVEAQVPGVSEKNTAFKNALASLQASNGAWATQTKAAYSEATGGSQLEVSKIGTGTSSQAFSNIGGTPAPGTPKPGTTSPGTGAPGTSNTTKSPTAGTPAPPTPAPIKTNATTTKKPTTGSSSSGAAGRSMLAAAAIAVASAALLF